MAIWSNFSNRDMTLDRVRRRYWIGRCQRLFPDFLVSFLAAAILKQKIFFGCHNFSGWTWVITIYGVQSRNSFFPKYLVLSWWTSHFLVYHIPSRSFDFLFRFNCLSGWQQLFNILQLLMIGTFIGVLPFPDADNINGPVGFCFLEFVKPAFI